MKKRISVFTLLIALLFVMSGCDNGSVSSSSTDNTNGLVKVSLTVDGQDSTVQKSISISGSEYVYQYKAVPQWTGTGIHGETTSWTTINYSGSMSLGYFTAGQWVFYIRVLNEGTPVFEGHSAVTTINSVQSSVTVAVAKIIQDATPGVVSVTVTAPTIDANTDALTVSWTGTASGSGAATPAVSGGITTFTFTQNNLPVGIYTFSLSHNNAAAKGSAIAVDLHQGEMAVITGHLDTGEWKLGYITVQLHTVTVERYNWGTELVPEYFGTVDIEIDSAVQGDRVSFSPKPVTGSSVNELSITCGGSPVSYTRNGDIYSFIMPEGDVTVYVKFTNVSTSIVDTMLFKALVKALYAENRATVTSFGQSANAPGIGIKPITLGDIKIWYDSTNTKICWYSEVERVNLGPGSLADLFNGCDRYTSISMENIITTAITNMAGMFQGCTGLTSLDVSGLDASSSTDMSNMFQGCTSLASLTLTGLTTNTTSSVNMAGMFKDCSSLTTLTGLSSLNASKATSLAGLFQGCTSLTGLDLTNFNAGSSRDISNMFQGCTNLASITLTGFTVNTTSSVNMSSMFKDCVNLYCGNGTLNLSSFDTTQATDMSYMFCACKKLKGINFGSNFNTANVTDMSYMFSSVDSGTAGGAANKMNLTSLDISGFNTANVTNMSHMFYMCSNSNLTTLDVSGFNTSRVTDMSYMFGCWSGASSYVTAFDLSSWDFSNVTTVNRMFDRCERAVITFPSHTTLNNIEDILYWFSHCFAMTPALLETVVNSWDFSGHVNTAALTALFAKADDANGEAVPNNRIMTNDMTNYKSTRQQFATHANNTVITTLYVGGNDLSKIRYQRLTTVANP